MHLAFYREAHADTVIFDFADEREESFASCPPHGSYQKGSPLTYTRILLLDRITPTYV